MSEYRCSANYSRNETCGAPATVAARTTDAPKGGTTTKVYWEVERAPRTAQPLCPKHATELLVDLVNALGRPE